MQKNGIDALKRMAQMAKSRLRNKVAETENKYSKKGLVNDCGLHLRGNKEV